jgi:hypothetical protein
MHVRVYTWLHAGQLACMYSPLRVPGELSGPLLVKHCIEVRCCCHLWFQDPSKPALIHGWPAMGTWPPSQCGDCGIQIWIL